MKNTNLELAKKMDQEDGLASFRQQFYFPNLEGKIAPGECLYFCGNSLGLQPKGCSDFILQELKDWQDWGVEGHLHAKNPWLPYHEQVTAPLANLVGAQVNEVVAMNSLTVNLNLLMLSFYQPVEGRYKVLMEADAFPSDHYSVQSHVRFHGYHPEEAIILLKARPGEQQVRTEDILEVIDQQGHEIATVMLGGVNYLTGQAFDMKSITAAAKKQGCKVGYDLAHATGNLEMQLHDWNVDFACWCSYKYLNAGPGAIAGIYVHERYANDQNLPKLWGWWGHNKKTRFAMPSRFDPLPGAESWQMSNPPIFQLAALRASLKIFQDAGIKNLRKKSIALTGFLETLVCSLPGIEIITPKDLAQRGCQLSFKVKQGEKLQAALKDAGVIVDFRKPDVVRAAPVPLYNSFQDVYRFSEIISQHAK